MNDRMITILKGANIVISGDFVFRSGAKSNLYLDVKKAYGNPELLNLISEEMYKVFSRNATCVAAMGHGGIAPASVISSRYGLPLVQVRKEAKDHGLGKLIDSYTPNERDVVEIVDDVFSSGSSLRDTIGILKPTGAIISGCNVVVKRGEGNIPAPLRYLITLDELMNFSQ